MSPKIEKENDKPSFFDYATEIVGWIQIVVSPLLLALLIAVPIYFANPTIIRLVIACGITLTGLITGVVFATWVWKKQGTIHFVSRIMATPELDDLDKETT